MSEVEPQLRAALEILLDPVAYAAAGVEDLASGMTPLEHFLSVGLQRGLSPHPLFDAAWYRSKHGLPGTENLFLHFMRVGERAGLAPGPFFDPAWYRHVNPDVAAAGVNSLVHYVEYGRGEGRSPSPIFDPTTPAGAHGVITLEASGGEDASWILAMAPRPTTLTRLMTGWEVTSYSDPQAVSQILLPTRTLETDEIPQAVVIGASRAVYDESGQGALLAQGARPGWALAHVTHMVAPRLGPAIHLLGLGEPKDGAQVEQWAAAVARAAGRTSSPHLLLDESMPSSLSNRLLSAAGPRSTAFRVPARRLLAVERLTMAL